MITLSIAGEDCPHLRVETASISAPKRGRRTARFSLFDALQSYAPSLGDPVVLTDGGTSFRGLITKVDESRAGGVMDCVFHNCECSDYAAIFDRRFVSRKYPAGSIAKNIILDICSNFLIGEGFDTNNVDGFAVISDELVFDYRSVTQCFEQISTLTGEDWWVGGAAGKSLYFKSISAAATAPFPITDSSENWRNLRVSKSMGTYRNRQYVRVGQPLQSGSLTDTFAGDGSTWFFPTRFPLTAAPSVTVGGVAQTVYEMGVDPYPSSGWFWIRNGSGVQQGTQTAVAAGVLVVVAYGQYLSSVVMAEDTAEQAARATTEGGSGVWESIEDARDVENLDVANALALALLSRGKALPTEIVYETDAPGLEPGMAQSISLSANRIGIPTPALYSVAQVESRDNGAPFPSGYYFRHTVTLSSALDQRDWLAWWLNFYQRSAGGATNAASVAVDVPDVTGVECGTPVGVVRDGTPYILIPVTFRAPSPLGIFNSYEFHYRIGSGQAVGLGVRQFSGSAGQVVHDEALIPYQYADCSISVYVNSRGANAADVLTL